MSGWVAGLWAMGTAVFGLMEVLWSGAGHTVLDAGNRAPTARQRSDRRTLEIGNEDEVPSTGQGTVNRRAGAV
jgi:hypothetical protein